MSAQSLPSTPKWPFVLADVLLLATAGGLAWFAHGGTLPFGAATAAVIAAAVAAGGWMLTRPFLLDHEVALRAAEQDQLAGTLDQIRLLQGVGREAQAAAAAFQGATAASREAREAIEETARRLQAERNEFTAALQKSNDQERQALRLELEKMHRGENEAMQVLFHLLDHTFALQQAGIRSGQPGLIQQLGQFRAACLDAARRLGIVAHEARQGDGFNPEVHEVPGESQPSAGTPVQGTIACGYSVRGTGVRRILVAVDGFLPAGGAPSDAAGANPDPQG